MTREVAEYVYTCNGCGKEALTGGESYPEEWVPADNDNFDDDGEDYCPTCQAQRQP